MDESGGKPVKREKRAPEEPDDSVFKKPRLPDRFKMPSPKKTPGASSSNRRVPQKVGEDEFMNILKAIVTDTLTEDDFKVTSAAPEYRNNLAMDVDSDEEDLDDKIPDITETQYNSENEDVYSDGEIDEELNAEVARLTLQLEERRIAEEEKRKNIPGPSNLGPCPVDDVTPMDTSPPPSSAELLKRLTEQVAIQRSGGQAVNTGNKRKPVVTLAQALELLLLYLKQEMDKCTKPSPHYFIHSPSYFQRVEEDPFYYFFHNNPRNMRLAFANGETCTLVLDKTGYLATKYGKYNIHRLEPRNVRVYAPIPQEVFLQHRLETRKHEHADKYPSDFTYGMVAYAEDPFWKDRDVLQVPERVLRPYITADSLFREPTEEMAPFDWNAVPPPPGDRPPHPALPAAYRLFERMKRDHLATEEAEKHMDVNDDVDPEGSL